MPAHFTLLLDGIRKPKLRETFSETRELYYLEIGSSDCVVYNNFLSLDQRWEICWIYGDEERDAAFGHVPKLYLRVLLDMDVASAPSLSVSEQHHLCWILSCLSGITPSSLGFSEDRPDEYLRWKDVEIKREEVGGYCRLGVKIIFSNRSEYFPDELDPRRAIPSMAADFTMASMDRNFPLSVPERFLAIALRHCVLADFTTVSEVLAAGATTYRFKPESLEEPVFLATHPSGHGLIYEPASAKSFVEYLETRTTEFGFPANDVAFSWPWKPWEAPMEDLQCGSLITQAEFKNPLTMSSVHELVDVDAYHRMIDIP